MFEARNFPFTLSALCFIALVISVRVGIYSRKWQWALKENEREDFGIILAASLTLLGLIMGFSFSMASARYDQRKNYEEAEANAIGTEYLRADLLPSADAARVRGLLKQYLQQRVLFYQASDNRQLQEIATYTARLQDDLWVAVRVPASATPTPIVALVLAGMNDVLNSEGYTQAAWWNRIPTAAWALMLAIAICCNLLLGYSSHGSERRAIMFMVLPLLVSTAFLLIADIDTPSGGVIRVRPQNLIRLVESFHQK